MFFTKIIIKSDFLSTISVKYDNIEIINVNGEWNEEQKIWLIQFYIKFPSNSYLEIKIGYNIRCNDYEDQITIYADNYKHEYIYKICENDVYKFLLYEE